MNIPMTSPLPGGIAAPTSRGDLARMLIQGPPSVGPAAQPPAPKPETAETQPATEQEQKGVRQSVERANEAARFQSVGLRFGIHEGSGEFWVQVLDSKTNEVIKTVPPEDLLDFRARLEQSLGILFDTKA